MDGFPDLRKEKKQEETSKIKTEVIWEVNADRKREGQKGNGPKMSIYQASDEYLTRKDNSKKLSYEANKHNTSYENAAEILQQIGWHPTASYAAAAYPAPVKINWKVIKWSQTPYEAVGNSQQDKETHTFVGILQNQQQVTSITAIYHEGEPPRVWINILGQKFTGRPTRGEGVAFMIGLQKTLQYVETAHKTAAKEKKKK